VSTTDDSGFLSRWARRKAEARRGAPEGVAADPRPESVPPIVAPAAPAGVPAAQARPAQSTQAGPEPSASTPPPTLDDVAQLTHESDYARFVARDVDPGVKHAAMRKLFSDPHFNVMDRLDVYIDDYGKPDPLPPGMLRKMAQARFLGLFDDEKEPDATSSEAVAAAPPPPEPAPDEDPDLRLQPHDAAGRQGPGPGAGQDPAGQH